MTSLTTTDAGARPATASLPLLTGRDLQAPLAWRHGAPISAACFIDEARALAGTLPVHGSPVNLCHDRYHFALALAAALLQGHTSLMPPNALPQTLQRLRQGAAGTTGDGSAGAPVYALIDDDTLDLRGLQRVRVQRPAAAGKSLDVSALRVSAASSASMTPVPLIPADLEAVRLLTSGSTGDPQPHGKRWASLVANIGAEARRLAQHLGRSDLQGLNIVATVPAQHSYGFESTVLLALLGGASFDAGRPFYPADVAAALQALPEPRALVTTPFHLKTLLRAGVALPRTVLTLSATAPLSPQLAAEAEAALQGVLVEIYGCTEAGQVASRRTTDGERWTTLGALRIDRVDAGTSADPADGSSSERYVVSGGHVTEPTPLADVLVLESPHHFRLLGRANDLIHVGGKRSSLSHLNFHLNRIDGVDDGAFWLPDTDGEAVVRPVAFVVAPTRDAAHIRVALQRELEGVFVPRRIVHVAALPRDATGKLTAAALRDFADRSLRGAPPTSAAQAAAAASASASASASTAAVDAEEIHRAWTVPADHPAFDGHFPGRPLLPGAVLLSWVMQALADSAALTRLAGAVPRIDQVKFLSPAEPLARLSLQLRARGRGVDFEVQRHAEDRGSDANGVAVARGRIVDSAAPVLQGSGT